MNETIVVEDGQAAVATTSVSGTLSSKSSATDTIAVVDTPSGKQAAVVTTSVSGTLSPASSATDTIAIVDTPSGKQAALKVYNLNGGGGGGGGAATKFGVSLDNIFPVAGSELLRPITPTTDQQFSLNMDGITKIDSKALAYKFYYNNAITGAEFPDLVEIYSDEACNNAFISCSNLKVISVPKLESINGAKACDSMFMFAGIEGQVSLPSLKTIQGSNACVNMFSYNSGITGVSVPSLTTIDGSSACRNMFKNTGLTRVDFPALTTITNANSLGTNSSSGMFAGCTGLLEIHFRADAQATIEGLSGYASKFGATNCTIYFDL